MRVAGYVRVSTDEQDKQGVSIPHQMGKIQLFSQLHDLELVEVVPDGGYSARSLDRPGIQKVLAMLDAGQVEGIVIMKLDRLTRRLADWLWLIETYFLESKHPKRLFSVGDSIDTRTAAGRLVLNVLMSVAQWEVEIISERTAGGMQQAIAQGQHCGKPRYGWRVDPDGKRNKDGRLVGVVPDPHEQRVKEMMRELRAQGLTFRRIVEQLRDAGIETREGGIWTPATISKILAREPLNEPIEI